MKIVVTGIEMVENLMKPKLDAFCRRSGIFFVSSGKLSEGRVNQYRDCMEFEAYFDSRAWTGLP